MCTIRVIGNGSSSNSSRSSCCSYKYWFLWLVHSRESIAIKNTTFHFFSIFFFLLSLFYFHSLYQVLHFILPCVLQSFPSPFHSSFTFPFFLHFSILPSPFQSSITLHTHTSLSFTSPLPRALLRHFNLQLVRWRTSFIFSQHTSQVPLPLSLFHVPLKPLTLQASSVFHGTLYFHSLSLSFSLSLSLSLSLSHNLVIF